MRESETARPTFGRRTQPPPRSVERPADGSLRALLETPHDKRDEAWGEAFLECVVEATFVERHSDLVSPAGHHAYAVAVANGEASAMTFARVADIAVKGGFALALFNHQGMEPGFVFKHGQLSAFAANGALLPLDTKPSGSFGTSVAVPGGAYITTNPGEGVLPPATRAALRTWLEEHRGVSDVRVCLRLDGLANEQAEKTFAIDLERIPGDEDAVRQLMRDIHWYLPPDIAVGMFPDMAKDRYFEL